MKITISAWPGAGGTTLSLLVAYNYNLRLIRGGDVFRYIYSKLEYGNTGEARIESHKKVEPHFGPIFDKYVDVILKDDSYTNILVESDIASFRIGKNSDIVSIFIHANTQARKKRTEVDNRADDGEMLTQVDNALRQEYLNLHNIDFLNLEQIQEKHRIVIDNSDLNLVDEMNIVHKFLNDNHLVAAESTLDFNKLNEMYWEKGKEFFIEQLNKKDLIPTPREILKDIEQKFTYEVRSLPHFLRNIIVS